ncbi:MAG: four helix bundle protein [Fidelibacterota bacterium]
MKVPTHKDLDIWKMSISLVKDIYFLTSTFPKEEKYGLITQMKRAAVSIPSNISEGAARNSRREYIQFLYISLGSLSELETQLIIADELDYSSQIGVILEKIEIIRPKMLTFIHYLKKKN